MLKWSDNVILLSSKPYGETGIIASVLSEKNGRYKGFVFGGNSKKKRATFQKGNLCTAHWKSRTSEQLGSLKIELIKSIAPNFMEQPIQLSALSSVCDIFDLILPEREPNHKLFNATIKLFELLKLSDSINYSWVKGYIKWELGVLSELGFSLKLNKCVVNNDSKNLAFVSPKTGRAVSYDIGLPYKNKLFILPKFLGGNYYQDNMHEDVLNGLIITQFFISMNFFKNSHLPSSRIRLQNQLEDKLSKV